MRARIMSITAALALIFAAALLHARAGGGTIRGKITTKARRQSPNLSNVQEPSCASSTRSCDDGNCGDWPWHSLENVVVYISAGADDAPPPARAMQAGRRQKSAPALL